MQSREPQTSGRPSERAIALLCTCALRLSCAQVGDAVDTPLSGEPSTTTTTTTLAQSAKTGDEPLAKQAKKKKKKKKKQSQFH